MDISNQILSDITVHMKYAKHKPEVSRRETWEEIVQRNKEMHLRKLQGHSEEFLAEVSDAYNNYVLTKKVLPSMRSMQFAGKPIEISPNRIYNCAFAPVDSPDVFSEAMFLLLGGTGFGYSVQKHHVEKLPEIVQPNPSKTRRYLVSDNIEGWADTIKILMKSYFGQNSSTPVFDFSDIRAKGAKLITSGGKAPGPGPLRECVAKITSILETKQNGSRLSPLEAHDIMCHIADAVLAVGIRRAALISLFSADDEEMLSCKSGKWYELHPHRGRANNSVVLLRQRITREFFMKLWDKVKASGAGEPGFYFTWDKDWGTNPCCEIALRAFQFCNLTEVNASDIVSQEDFNNRVRVAAFLGTLQAMYTDFHYLRDIWKKTTEKDALIGVGLTGIADGSVLNYNMKEAAEIVKAENKRVAGILGIKPAARTTCVKPSGTSSLALGTASGVHARFAPYYIRRMRVGKNEAIYQYLNIYHPELLEDCFFRPHDTAIISVPQKSPAGSILRTESALETLDRVRTITENWVRPGHRNGMNTHNVSCTISIKDNEWESVGSWMWNNREYYNGIAVLPYDGGTYVQAPFEVCTEEKYNELMQHLTKIDLLRVIELDDNTDLSGELACAGGACEI
jgi:ribonucleoside-diphosphate reductase alpha chain